jgi:hypothetical protein
MVYIYHSSKSPFKKYIYTIYIIYIVIIGLHTDRHTHTHTHAAVTCQNVYGCHYGWETFIILTEGFVFFSLPPGKRNLDNTLSALYTIS